MRCEADCEAADGWGWRCPSCRHRQGARAYSFVEKSKLTLVNDLNLIFLWACDWAVGKRAQELAISQKTVCKKYALLEAACLFAERMQVSQIGGVGHVVEIDECQLCRKEKGMGGCIPGSDVWIFGGIDRQNEHIFMEVVDDRSRETLSRLMHKYILPGTSIISDCWRSYDGLENWGHAGWTHSTVNHAFHFVDPTTGAHTQNIERLWRELRRRARAREGIPKHKADAYVAEFMRKRTWKMLGTPPFEGALMLVAATPWPIIRSAMAHS